VSSGAADATEILATGCSLQTNPPGPVRLPKWPRHNYVIYKQVVFLARRSALTVKRLAIGGGQMSTRPYLISFTVPFP